MLFVPDDKAVLGAEVLKKKETVIGRQETKHRQSHKLDNRNFEGI